MRQGRLIDEEARSNSSSSADALRVPASQPDSAPPDGVSSREALLTWHEGEATWAEAMARYEDEATAKMRPMFDATMGRVK
jgi:hypothetical protein